MLSNGLPRLTRIESKSRRDCQFPFYTKTQHKLNRGGAREIEKVTRLGNLHRVYSITPRSVTVANERRDERARRRRRKGRRQRSEGVLYPRLASSFLPSSALSLPYPLLAHLAFAQCRHCAKGASVGPSRGCVIFPRKASHKPAELIKRVTYYSAEKICKV